MKTAIITGASGALGVPTLERFKQAGWKLALIAHSNSSRESLQAEQPESLVLQGDLSSETQAQAVALQVQEQYGQIDALLNIAGGFAMKAAVEMTVEDLEAQMNMNFRTVVNATRAVLPGMLERGEGFILGVAAGAALNGGARMGAYAASKAAMVAYLKSVTAEVGAKGVGVSILYPMGTIDTPDNRKSMPDTDPARWINPEGLAESILHLATRSPRDRIRELMVYPPS